MKKPPSLSRAYSVQATFIWRGLAVWGLLFFLLFVGQNSWAHGSSHTTSSLQQEATALASPWNAVAPSVQEHQSSEHASTQHSGTCSDCHLCCALQHRLPTMPLSERTPSSQPAYRATHYSSKPLSPELPPPILVRAM